MPKPLQSHGMEDDLSPLHLLADTAVSVLEGELTLPGELPIIFRNKVQEMHGQDVMLVLEKRLWAADMDLNQGRLSIPKLQIRANFLRDEEIQTLDDKEGITVSLIEPCLEIRNRLQLKRWNYKSGTFSYVLTKQWNPVVRRFDQNQLKVHGLVQLWSFRVNGDLWFCLVNCEAPPAAE